MLKSEPCPQIIHHTQIDRRPAAKDSTLGYLRTRTLRLYHVQIVSQVGDPPDTTSSRQAHPLLCIEPSRWLVTPPPRAWVHYGPKCLAFTTKPAASDEVILTLRQGGGLKNHKAHEDWYARACAAC